MSIDPEAFARLLKKRDKFQRDLNLTEGALSQIMGRLESDFNVSTLEEAESLLEESGREAKVLEKDFEKSLSEHDRKFSTSNED